MAIQNPPDPGDGLLVPGRTRALAAIKRIKDELADLEKIVKSIKEAPPRLGTGAEVHPEPKRQAGGKAKGASS
jgi:hypothetical protein